MGTRPLEGIVVIDVSTSYAGPFCSMSLGDLGATVIKVEKSSGDDCRTWGPPFVGGESAWFLSVNRNKKSVCIDFSKPAGLDLLYRLLEKGDVFIENLKPTSLEKFGLDYATVHEKFPHVVYASISGFGLTGPESSRTGYDLIAQAMSGLMSVTGGPDGEPQRVGTALSDITTGLTAAFAISAKLVERHRTGIGGLIDVSLLDVDVSLMSPRIMSYLVSGELPVANGGVDSVISIYQKLQTKDEPIVLSTGTQTLWERFKTCLGNPESLESERYASNSDRQKHRADLVEAVEVILAQRTAAEWLDVFTTQGVPCARINYLNDVVNEPQLIARDMFPEIAHPSAGNLRLVGSPIHLDGESVQIPCVPPTLAQDTDEVLRSMGYDSDGIDELEKENVIVRSHFGREVE